MTGLKLVLVQGNGFFICFSNFPRLRTHRGKFIGGLHFHLVSRVWQKLRYTRFGAFRKWFRRWRSFLLYTLSNNSTGKSHNSNSIFEYSIEALRYFDEGLFKTRYIMTFCINYTCNFLWKCENVHVHAGIYIYEFMANLDGSLFLVNGHYRQCRREKNRRENNNVFRISSASTMSDSV